MPTRRATLASVDGVSTDRPDPGYWPPAAAPGHPGRAVARRRWGVAYESHSSRSSPRWRDRHPPRADRQPRGLRRQLAHRHRGPQRRHAEPRRRALPRRGLRQRRTGRGLAHDSRLHTCDPAVDRVPCDQRRRERLPARVAVPVPDRRRPRRREPDACDLERGRPQASTCLRSACASGGTRRSPVMPFPLAPARAPSAPRSSASPATSTGRSASGICTPPQATSSSAARSARGQHRQLRRPGPGGPAAEVVVRLPAGAVYVQARRLGDHRRADDQRRHAVVADLAQCLQRPVPQLRVPLSRPQFPGSYAGRVGGDVASYLVPVDEGSSASTPPTRASRRTRSSPSVRLSSATTTAGRGVSPRTSLARTSSARSARPAIRSDRRRRSVPGHARAAGRRQLHVHGRRGRPLRPCRSLVGDGEVHDHRAAGRQRARHRDRRRPDRAHQQPHAHVCGAGQRFHGAPGVPRGRRSRAVHVRTMRRDHPRGHARRRRGSRRRCGWTDSTPAARAFIVDATASARCRGRCRRAASGPARISSPRRRPAADNSTAPRVACPPPRHAPELTLSTRTALVACSAYAIDAGTSVTLKSHFHRSRRPRPAHRRGRRGLRLGRRTAAPCG